MSKLTEKERLLMDLEGTSDLHRNRFRNISEEELKTIPLIGTPKTQVRVNGKRVKHGLYYDSKGILTTGFGHKVLESDREKIKELASLTYKKALSFLRKEIPIYEKRVSGKIKNYHTYPLYLQLQLLQADYRGDVGYKTRRDREGNLIPQNWWTALNKGNYEEAAKRFLNNQDYRESRRSGSGVHLRMEGVRDALLKYSKFKLQQEGIKRSSIDLQDPSKTQYKPENRIDNKYNDIISNLSPEDHQRFGRQPGRLYAEVQERDDKKIVGEKVEGEQETEGNQQTTQRIS